MYLVVRGPVTVNQVVALACLAGFALAALYLKVSCIVERCLLFTEQKMRVIHNNIIIIIFIQLQLGCCTVAVVLYMYTFTKRELGI